MRHAFYYWLSAEPPILRYVADDGIDLGQFLPESRVFRLPIYYWHRTAQEIARDHEQALALRPRHIIRHLINERNVCLELQGRGVPATFCNHNALLDETIFRNRAGIPKEFDAVYTARMSPFKRHWLAKGVRSLLVIGGVIARGDSPDYFEQVRCELPTATFTNVQGVHWLTPDEVASWTSRARVGLCLSACEGTMYAATEYLLCGLPVVSTRNVGGRNEWFDPEFSRIVDDDPAAVAEAVEELISLRLPPQEIREATLRRMAWHRKQLIQIVQGICDTDVVRCDFARDWERRFFHKMGKWRDPSSVMRHLAEDCPSRIPG